MQMCLLLLTGSYEVARDALLRIAKNAVLSMPRLSTALAQGLRFKCPHPVREIVMMRLLFLVLCQLPSRSHPRATSLQTRCHSHSRAAQSHLTVSPLCQSIPMLLDCDRNISDSLRALENNRKQCWYDLLLLSGTTSPQFLKSTASTPSRCS